jgi:hypothetical protein
MKTPLRCEKKVLTENVDELNKAGTADASFSSNDEIFQKEKIGTASFVYDFHGALLVDFFNSSSGKTKQFSNK